MIPLVLMAGFLGAGKTRFLTQLVPALAARGVRSRIILNDFENATIDAARLGALDALVTPLNGECVCCGSLRELLQQLYDTPNDPGSVMLIEANGATETDELLGHLTTDARLGHFTLPLQLTIVDAAKWQKRWFSNALERAQVRTATHVQLNWMERLGDARRTAVRASVREVAPNAALVQVDDYADTLTALSQEVHAAADRGGRAPAAAPAHRHGHTHPFGSLALPLPRVVDRAAFTAFVRDLPATVVRAKGMIRFADAPTAMWVWHKVPGRRSLKLDRSEFHDDAESTALFIGVGMDPDDLSARIAGLSRP
ncbi:MAG: GTP-binding protein [Gemmatimonadaceae bacterium]|nr:GTP-binding protein [Gemmatimonadaceae bacterium]